MTAMDAESTEIADGTDSTERRLVFLRHAKSAYPHGVPDHERPLAGRGRRNAQAAGEWLVTEGPRPDLVLCSDAQRARHTWEIVAGCLPVAPTVTLEPRLYGASPQEIVDLVRATQGVVQTLVLVGHEPTMSASVLMLAGEGSDATALARLIVKFPTSAIAVLRVPGPWRTIGPGRAVLEAFEVPRA